MGATHYTDRVDEWGAGCVALELLLGASPFKGKPGNECTCPEVSHYNYNSDQVGGAARGGAPRFAAVFCAFLSVFCALLRPGQGSRARGALSCGDVATRWLGGVGVRRVSSPLSDGRAGRVRSLQLTKIFSMLGTPPDGDAAHRLAWAPPFAAWPRRARLLEAKVPPAPPPPRPARQARDRACRALAPSGSGRSVKKIPGVFPANLLNQPRC